MSLLLDEFVERYASILNGRDINELFNHLREISNRSEAARICDLERRTTYYWEDNREVRLLTKQKVLRAALEKDFEYAIEYILTRIHNTSSDLLELHLGAIYEKAMNPRIETTYFQMLSNKFREARIRHSPLVNSTIATEVSDMFENLRNRADELGITFPPLPMSTMSIEEVKNLLPQLMKVVPSSINNATLEEFSRKFVLPREFVKFASDLNTISIPFSDKTVQRDAVNLGLWAAVVGLKDGENVPFSGIFPHKDLENPGKTPILLKSAQSGHISYRI